MAALCACGSPLTALPDGVSVSIGQNRLDYAPRALEISVTNDSPDELTITRAEFHSPLFDGTTAWTRDVTVQAGTTVDLRVLLGAPVCGAGVAASTVVSFTTARGETGRAETVPADRFDTVARVGAEDCLVAHTAQIVALRAGGALRTERRGGETVALLDLEARPTGAAGVATITGVGRTTLVGPADHSTGWALGWAASAASAPLSTTLALVPSNCNPHIVAEDKRGTYFPLTVALDNGEAGTVFVGVSDAVREQVYAYIAAYCGW